MNQFLSTQSQPEPRTTETDSQQVISTSSGISLGKIFITLLTLIASGAGAYYTLKPSKKDSNTVEETETKTESLPVKKGQTLIDPETGEELIVTKKGGRKKKVSTEQVTPKT